jgi:RHS repeat-associated protein
MSTGLWKRYEYDVFGTPHEREMNRGMNLGYTGKLYDTVTGLYNYGYRDYEPETVRFTTVDPIRDSVNWFAYVNNDPVNWVDLWRLSASDAKPSLFSSIANTLTQLFKDDNSTQIYTLGLTGGATTYMTSRAGGLGVYYNPRNEVLMGISTLLLSNPVTSGIGAAITVFNIDDMGVYGAISAGPGIGKAGSAGVSAGIYKSLEDAQGGYAEIGGSLGIAGNYSVGVDGVVNLETGEIVGGNISLGKGFGVWEAHGRFGVSGFFSFFGN